MRVEARVQLRGRTVQSVQAVLTSRRALLLTVLLLLTAVLVLQTRTPIQPPPMVNGVSQIPPTPAPETLTHPLRSCLPTQHGDRTMHDLEVAIAQRVRQAKAQGVRRVGVRIADLNSCEHLTLGAQELFIPASLMKVPVAVAWLRKLGTGAHALEQVRLTYNLPPAITAPNEPVDAQALQPGQSYTVRTLLERMLIGSANDALNLLGMQVPPQQFEEIWSELGVKPLRLAPEVEVTVEDMAAMFQALYDGNWLNRQGSAMLLGWLAQAKWQEGLQARLPANAVVAHKYGIRYLQDALHPETWNADVPALQLGDCGIVYKPNQPMLVCVMTEGQSLAAVQTLIADVARMAWDQGQGLEIVAGR